MKKLILLFLLLICISGCVTSKNKIKDKQGFSSISDLTKNTKSDTKVTETTKQNRKDSVFKNINYNISRNNLFANQNFQLKNNGKCADPGVLRNVEFTDALGNKTSIPVNDNIELNFQNESEFKKEIELLKFENKQLSETALEAKKKYEYMHSAYEELNQKINSKSSHTNIKTEKSTVWLFALCVFLSIAVWEAIKKLIKKYIP